MELLCFILLLGGEAIRQGGKGFNLLRQSSAKDDGSLVESDSWSQRWAELKLKPGHRTGAAPPALAVLGTPARRAEAVAFPPGCAGFYALERAGSGPANDGRADLVVIALMQANIIARRPPARGVCAGAGGQFSRDSLALALVPCHSRGPNMARAREMAWRRDSPSPQGRSMRGFVSWSCASTARRARCAG